MNKKELVEKVAQKACITKKDAGLAVQVVLEVITQELCAGDKVQLTGFGSFEVRERAPRVGRNPKTGHALIIPITKLPVFKPGKDLKDAIRQ